MRRYVTARLAGIPLLLLAVAAVVAALGGCSKGVTPPKRPTPLTPHTDLTYAPVQNDTVSFRVHFYWSGYSDDAEIVAFRWIVDPDSATAKNPLLWHLTTAKDTTLLFQVDPIKAVERHLFEVAAVDNKGLIDPNPAKRYFSASTLPPTSKIEKGPLGGGLIVGPNFTYEWSGIDPDGGESGGKAPVDSFQYLLLRLQSVADTSAILPPWHVPLPTWDPNLYVNTIIGRAVGDTLPYPYGDWRWVGVSGLKHRFRNVTPGQYVFAERAVDIAGATEKGLGLGTNIRQFAVSTRNPGPQLTINASIFNAPLPSATGPEDFQRKHLQIFQGEPISFSWTADASAYGGEIVGFNWALDDTSALGTSFDIKNTGHTFPPSALPPGAHNLYVRVVDDGGLITNAVIPFDIFHPSFRDPGAPREILYVDDSMAPGNSFLANPPFPSDITEDNFWGTGTSPGQLMLIRIKNSYGVLLDSWDTSAPPPVPGISTIEGRVPPTPAFLQNVSTVVWVADFNNTTSSPIGLWQTLVGGNYSVLAGYMRAGGTVIITGYNLVADACSPSSLLDGRTRGLCGSFEPGSAEWSGSYFPRQFMGVDYMISNPGGRRFNGARDFEAAIPTVEGTALGFQAAYVDTGIVGTGAKWDTKSNLSPTLGDTYLDLNLAPGLPAIEGWIMATTFGCEDIADFGREDKTVAIARPIYTYHGVNEGIAQNAGPSPREGRVVGILCQSHDLGLASGGGASGVLGQYDSRSAVGRCVFFGFPLYFIHDQQSSDALFNAFTYVNQSPTLP